MLTLACAWYLWHAPLALDTQFTLGGADPLNIIGFHDAETSVTGRGFRWTTDASTLLLMPRTDSTHVLRLTASTLPTVAAVPITVTINATHVAAFVSQRDVPRVYSVLVPTRWIDPSLNTIRVQSPTFQPPQDTGGRNVGIALFTVTWNGLAAPRWLVPAQISVLVFSMIFFAVALAAARVPWNARALALVLFALILLTMRHSDARFVYRWHAIVMTLLLGVGSAFSALLLHRALPETRASARSWADTHWRAAAGYTIITILLLLPLLQQFTTHIIGAPGDAFEYLWKLQWIADAVRQYRSPMFAPGVFYPVGIELTISEMTPANTLLGLPFTWAFGPVASYNILIIASFVLTGFFTYLVAVRLGAARGAAFVAGLIVAFCIRRWYHASGHFGMMASQWMILALYGWEGVLTRRRLWDGFVAGVGMALTCWSSWHYGATFPLLLVLYTPFRVGLRRLPTLLACWQPTLLAALVTVALVMPFAQPYVEAQLHGETYQHIYTDLYIYSVNPQAYILPNPFHPLWGAWAARLYRKSFGEQYVALGYSVVVLALAGVWYGRRQGHVHALVAVSIVAFVASLGPELVRTNGEPNVVLPIAWVYYHVPVLNDIRSWGRMSIYVVMCSALLASVALNALPAHRQRTGWIIAAALVLCEYLSVFHLADTAPRAVDLWLHDQPGQGAVASFPDGETGASQYYSLFWGKPTNQGTGKFLPASYTDEHRALHVFPAPAATQLLQRWNTDYIIVQKDALRQRQPTWRATLAAQPQVTLVYEDATYCVYRLTHANSTP